MKRLTLPLIFFILVSAGPTLRAQDKEILQPMDVFRLEYAADPQISPDGKYVVYVRTSMDIKKDKRRTSLWIINVDGGDHHALTKGEDNERMPRWSPDGKSIVFTSERNGSADLFRVNSDGSGLKALTTDPAYDDQAAFSPDGQFLGTGSEDTTVRLNASRTSNDVEQDDLLCLLASITGKNGGLNSSTVCNRFIGIN